LGSSTGLRRAGGPLKLRGRIDLPIPYPFTLAERNIPVTLFESARDWRSKP
jgi:hypothetical protein